MGNEVQKALDVHKAFEKFKESTDYGCNIKHLHGCEYEAWASVPVSECQCDCYEIAYFQAGIEYKQGEK